MLYSRLANSNKSAASASDANNDAAISMQLSMLGGVAAGAFEGDGRKRGERRLACDFRGEVLREGEQ